MQWDTLIGLKVREFARYLIGKGNRFDLKSPAPVLERPDSKELRERILSLSTSEARRLGLGKSTLHYSRNKTKYERSFKVYEKTRRKTK